MEDELTPTASIHPTWPSPAPTPVPTVLSVSETIEGILTEEDPQEDILKVTDRLLKQALQLKATQVTLKEIMMLTAITWYVKLYREWGPGAGYHGQQYKQPAQAISLAIACHFAKGPSFVCKIREMTWYVTGFQWLPE